MLLPDITTDFNPASKTPSLAQPHVAEDGAEWNIQTSQFVPWKGGFYEGMVALNRNALRKAVGKAILNKSFRTYLTETEATVEERPLTSVIERQEYWDHLTFSFLTGRCF